MLSRNSKRSNTHKIYIISKLKMSSSKIVKQNCQNTTFISFLKVFPSCHSILTSFCKFFTVLLFFPIVSLCLITNRAFGHGQKICRPSWSLPHQWPVFGRAQMQRFLLFCLFVCLPSFCIYSHHSTDQILAINTEINEWIKVNIIFKTSLKSWLWNIGWRNKTERETIFWVKRFRKASANCVYEISSDFRNSNSDSNSNLNLNSNNGSFLN